MSVVLRLTKTPPLYGEKMYSANDHPTDRVCSADGCENPGREVEGHYFVESRRVRVWVCPDHWTAQREPKTLPTPRSIAIALKGEEERQRKIESIMRNTPEQVSESVRAFAPSGSGEIPKFNLADGFRWGENPGDVRTRIHQITPLEALQVKYKRLDLEAQKREKA